MIIDCLIIGFYQSHYFNGHCPSNNCKNYHSSHPHRFVKLSVLKESNLKMIKFFCSKATGQLGSKNNISIGDFDGFCVYFENRF